MSPTKSTRIAIIGAGMAGAVLARRLTSCGNVTVFEKSRGVGGRMATRRTPQGYFDHGAPYLTITSPEFQEFLVPFIESAVLQPWCPRQTSLDAATGTQTPDRPSAATLWVGCPGMNALAKALLQEQDLRISTHITQLDFDRGWSLLDSQGQTHGPFDWVISTAPGPQTAALLPKDCSFYRAVGQRKMTACYALMLGLEHAPEVDWDVLHLHNATIQWMAQDQSKPGRPDSAHLLIHASHAWSETKVDAPMDDVLNEMLAETQRLISTPLPPVTHQALHRWRYARPLSRSPMLLMDVQKKLAVAGDWCGGGSVESAFQSAHQLVRALTEVIDV